jgi:hypothetical protein
MKLGFVFECWIDGPDYNVMKHLVNWIRPDAKFEAVTIGDKGLLLDECADNVAIFLKTGCDKVFIVWDLMPKYANCDCIVDERNLIRQQLINKNVPLVNVEFIGIVHELESWLIADVSAIERVLSTPAHPVSIANIRHPDREVNPKKKLRRLFNQHKGTDYNDLDSAIRIIAQVQRPRDLRQSISFKRFYLKLTGNVL